MTPLTPADRLKYTQAVKTMLFPVPHDYARAHTGLFALLASGQADEMRDDYANDIDYTINRIFSLFGDIAGIVDELPAEGKSFLIERLLSIEAVFALHETVEYTVPDEESVVLDVLDVHYDLWQRRHDRPNDHPDT